MVGTLNRSTKPNSPKPSIPPQGAGKTPGPNQAIAGPTLETLHPQTFQNPLIKEYTLVHIRDLIYIHIYILLLL